MKNLTFKTVIVGACVVTALYIGGCKKKVTESSELMTESTLITTTNVITSTETTFFTTNSTNTSSLESLGTTTNASAALTLDDIISGIDKKVTIVNKTTKDAAAIGAVEGKEITVGANKFDIYKFDNQSKLNEAKAGKMSVTSNGSTTSMNAKVNGNFVLLYKTADNKVIDAFLGMK